MHQSYLETSFLVPPFRPSVLLRAMLAGLRLCLILFGTVFGQIASIGSSKDSSVQFVRSFSTGADALGNRTPCQQLRDKVNPSAAGDLTRERPAVCDKILDIVAGKADRSALEALPIRGERVVVDSNLRVLITEAATRSVHILDFTNRKYLRIDGAKGDRMHSPYAIAVDAANNIYVTDLNRGRIAVFDPYGKFKRYIGVFKGEGYFDRPRAIAIDGAAGRIYVADSARNFVLILDLGGKLLAQIGKRGGGDGPAEFLEPTEIAMYGSEIFVLDKRNDRIQVLDRAGHFRRQYKLMGTGATEARGMALDAEGRLFVPSFNWVEVFNREGELLFRFGKTGDQPGEFQTLKGICTDSKDRVYVMDSGNSRIQVFQVTNQPRPNAEASR